MLLSSFYPLLQKSSEALVLPIFIIIESASWAAINVRRTGHHFHADSNAVQSLLGIVLETRLKLSYEQYQNICKLISPRLRLNLREACLSSAPDT